MLFRSLDVWDDALAGKYAPTLANLPAMPHRPSVADFQQVLALDPTNDAVKQDIDRVRFLIKNGKKPTRVRPPPTFHFVLSLI